LLAHGPKNPWLVDFFIRKVSHFFNNKILKGGCEVCYFMGQKSCGFVTFFLTCFSLLGSMVILCIEMKKVKKEEMEGK
jgi:hypothetical protein